jgi:hypothetical protein
MINKLQSLYRNLTRLTFIYLDLFNYHTTPLSLFIYIKIFFKILFFITFLYIIMA